MQISTTHWRFSLQVILHTTLTSLKNSQFLSCIYTTYLWRMPAQLFTVGIKDIFFAISPLLRFCCCCFCSFSSYMTHSISINIKTRRILLSLFVLNFYFHIKKILLLLFSNITNMRWWKKTGSQPSSIKRYISDIQKWERNKIKL